MDFTITQGVIMGAQKFLIYGPEGIGKSTLVSQMPNPLFIDTEGGTKLLDVRRLPAPSSFAYLLEEVRYVIQHPEVCRTLIIDTADWAEKLCSEEVCSKAKKHSIEDFGYGKGYTYLQEEFGRLLNLLDDVLNKGIHVGFTAHAKMRKFEQPDETGAYDRWELKLTKQVAPMVKEWADMVLFANYETFVVNVDGQGAEKGVNKVKGGKRVMFTTHHPCWDAKNRHNLPERIEMSYPPIAFIFNPVASEAPLQYKEPVQSVPVQLSPASAATPTTPVSTVVSPEHKASPAMEQPVAPTQQPQPASVNPAPVPTQEQPAAVPAVNTSKVDVPLTIPKALRDLMIANNVDVWDIQMVVSAKGYYPSDTRIEDYDPGFIEGVLVGAWSQVFAMIQQMRKDMNIPFD